MAHIAGLSVNSFARLFKEQTGISPQSFILRRRIEKACILLHHTSASIDIIAESCGFTNRYYFSRMFRKEINISPAAYRKRKSF
ncbi:MAG: AraC family transcriptional regulator [Victivallales bacterium]|nr:AraC family transcriptional regulator [Victivallales bacterium]